MNSGVDVNVQWRQQAPVDGHGCNRGRLDSPGADLGDGVGAHRHAAEAPSGHAHPWAAATLAPQTHGYPVWRLHC